MRSMRTLVFTFVTVVTTVLSLAAPRAASAAQTWQVSLSIGGDPASVEAIHRAADGPLWVAGGHTSASSYDVPTVWGSVGGQWHEYPIPVDLTAKWGYLQDVAPVSATDAWAVGQVIYARNGQPYPLVAHWDGTAWRVVTEAWATGSTSTGSFSAVVARSATDVWAFGDEYEGSTSVPMAWHFDGFVWSRESFVVRNPSCSTGYDIVVTSAAATADGVYVSANCTTDIFQWAATVMFFDGRRWSTVLHLGSYTTVMGLGADPAGTVWGGGYSFVGNQSHATAWHGNASGFDAGTVIGPAYSIIYAAAANATHVVLAGEIGGGPNGPVPLLADSKNGGPFTLQSVPFDRQLSAAYVAPTGRLWVGGPSFGGWLGSQPPEATVLTRG